MNWIGASINISAPKSRMINSYPNKLEELEAQLLKSKELTRMFNSANLPIGITSLTQTIETEDEAEYSNDMNVESDASTEEMASLGDESLQYSEEEATS